MTISRSYTFPTASANVGAVSSVFARTGDVVADSGDYAGIYTPSADVLASISALDPGIGILTTYNGSAAHVTLEVDTGLSIINPTGYNGGGSAANPKISLDLDLVAVAGLSGTGIARRTGANTWTVGTAVSFSELQDLTALSVLGRSGSAAGVMAAITASTVGHVLQLNDASTALVFREPSFATRTLAGAIRQGRFPEASGTPFLYQIGVTNATTSTTQAGVANRCIFIPFRWIWTSAQRWDQMVCEVTTGSAAGTKLRMGIYKSGSDGLPASLIYNTTDIDANANAIKTETVSAAGTWTDTSYRDGSNYFYATPGEVLWGALHLESTATMRAVAGSACESICMLTGTLTAQNLLYISSTFSSGMPTAPSGFSTANGNRQLLCLRGVP